jgi:hypothetical protein
VGLTLGTVLRLDVKHNKENADDGGKTRSMGVECRGAGGFDLVRAPGRRAVRSGGAPLAGELKPNTWVEVSNAKTTPLCRFHKLPGRVNG